MELCYKELFYLVLNTFFFFNNNNYIIFNFFFFLKANSFNNFQLYHRKTYIFYFFKLIFRGKGFRVRKFKNKNKITFNFNYSHWSRLVFNIFFLFKIRRQNYPFFLIPYLSALKLRVLFKFIKYLNKYTKRGLRVKKQIIKRRFGKVSQVSSILH